MNWKIFWGLICLGGFVSLCNLQLSTLVYFSFKIILVIYMCYGLAESVGNREHWLWDITRKKNEFLLFSIVWESFNWSWHWNHWFDVGGIQQMYLSNKWALQLNRKLKISHVHLQTNFPGSHHIFSIQVHTKMTIMIWSINVHALCHCLK